ncbi:MAG TPA: threonylcarbamoyl-AMP synthase [Deltaproteobacteria bacterium]|nr:threonylcarbamoyl-AMP synthase [Deltaproteobacteria bacterium]
MALVIDADAAYDEALRAVSGGGVVAYPTETFYGLAVDPFNVDAVKRLFALKGRDYSKPLSLIVGDASMLARVVSSVPPAAEPLMRRFWPGPLTLVFPASEELPPIVTAGSGRVAVRVSSSPAATRLAAELASPITATSANPSGRPAPVTAAQVVEYFGDGLDVVIDGGGLPGRLGSTIVDVTSGRLEIVREGEIPARRILSS